MNIALLITMILSSFKGQEKAFVITEGTKVLTAENARVSAGNSDAEIATAIKVLSTMAFAEQDALVAILTAKLQPVK